ncbi:hypothetical protein P8452_18505 [Trifolium repens]|nr:hypothetical protein P8452_18505 [Trifolium repens]
MEYVGFPCEHVVTLVAKQANLHFLCKEIVEVAHHHDEDYNHFVELLTHELNNLKPKHRDVPAPKPGVPAYVPILLFCSYSSFIERSKSPRGLVAVNSWFCVCYVVFYVKCVYHSSNVMSRLFLGNIQGIEVRR